MPAKTAIVTITSKNYLAKARAFAQSVRQVHPDRTELDCVVLIVDEIEGYYDRNQEQDYQTILASELPVPHFKTMAFRYNVTELNTNIKADFLLELLRLGYERILYFDSDIIIYHSLDGLLAELDDANIILIPHLVDILPRDGLSQNEQDILRAGSYNLGFIGMRQSDETKRMLEWWADRMSEGGYNRPEHGMFLDQKWADLMPCYFEGVKILRNPGYDIAYWNIGQRLDIDKQDGQLSVNGQPLVFYHFSGYDPFKPDILSKHQNRYTVRQLPLLYQELFDDYGQRLRDHGHEICIQWPYHYDFFDNGVAISHYMRLYIEAADPQGKLYPEPFSPTFLDHLTSPISKRGLISSIGAILHQQTPNIQRQFLRPLNEDEVNFAVWLTRNYPEGLARVPDPPKAGGVTLLGYLRDETGVGESARSLARSLKQIHYPFSVYPLTENSGTRKNDHESDQYDQGLNYKVNLLVVNADMAKVVQSRLPAYGWNAHYNIGMVAWELNRFPRQWTSHLEIYDEVWTPSNFVGEAAQVASSKPVRVVPYPVEFPIPAYTRADLKLPEDQFIALFVFDAYSVVERKNPLAVIEAFKRANLSDALLIIKSTGLTAFPDSFKAVKAAIEQVNGILLDGYMTKDKVNGLIKCCDVYMSLHRSEGFGLTMAEAMYMGKPVIATNYGGSTDFVNSQTAYPVSFKLVKLEQDYPPYPAGNVWAEADVDQAANLLKYLQEHPEAVQLVGDKAAKAIRWQYSRQMVGELMKSHLDKIGDC